MKTKAVGLGGVAGAVAGVASSSASASGSTSSRPAGKNPQTKERRSNDTASMGSRAGAKVGAVLDTKNKVKDKATALKENIRDMPTQTAYALHSVKEQARHNVSDFKRGVVKEKESRQAERADKLNQHRATIADKRLTMQQAQEARPQVHKTDGSATAGASRPHERPVTASTPKAGTDRQNTPDTKTRPTVKEKISDVPTSRERPATTPVKTTEQKTVVQRSNVPQTSPPATEKQATQGQQVRQTVQSQQTRQTVKESRTKKASVRKKRGDKK